MEPESRRIRFVVFTMVLALALNVLSAWKHLGWASATAITLLVLVLDCVYIARCRDSVLGHWLLLGVVAGWLELVTDWWLVAVTLTLVYPDPQPKIWMSPAYMPFAWATVLAQLGVIGAWIGRRLPRVPATLVTALISAGYIPLYETLARQADWWFYHRTPLIWSATPYYIIGAEFLTVLPLVAMARAVERGRLGWTLALGVAEGAWLFVAFALAYRLLG
jgi:hypothetical protein